MLRGLVDLYGLACFYVEWDTVGNQKLLITHKSKISPSGQIETFSQIRQYTKQFVGLSTNPSIHKLLLNKFCDNFHFSSTSGLDLRPYIVERGCACTYRLMKPKNTSIFGDSVALMSRRYTFANNKR